jgi:hypothetical protein
MTRRTASHRTLFPDLDRRLLRLKLETYIVLRCPPRADSDELVRTIVDGYLATETDRLLALSRQHRNWEDFWAQEEDNFLAWVSPRYHGLSQLELTFSEPNLSDPASAELAKEREARQAKQAQKEKARREATRLAKSPERRAFLDALSDPRLTAEEVSYAQAELLAIIRLQPDQVDELTAEGTMLLRRLAASRPMATSGAAPTEGRGATTPADPGRSVESAQDTRPA